MKRVAVIGCGALGSILARNFHRVLGDSYALCGLLANHYEHAEALGAEVGAPACRDLPELLAQKPDLVVEIAGGSAVRQHGEGVLRAGCSLVVVSIGALADAGLKAGLEAAARETGAMIYLVNGAIGGLDLMQTMALMGGASAAIESSKAPRSLNGAPGLGGRELPADREEIAFSGSVEQAIAGFPKNVNVAVATALASGCPDTRVSVRSVPGIAENRHAIRLESPVLSAEITVRARPDPENPRSSTATAWSVLALLKNLAGPIFMY